MEGLIRVSGIYDQKTIQELKNSSINLWAFDFNPRSFNFIQTYRFLELIQKNYNSKANIKVFLQFTNEKKFIVEKITSDLKNLLFNEMGVTLLEFERDFFLEFRSVNIDSLISLDVDNFNMKYYLEFDVNTIVTLQSQMHTYTLQNCTGFIHSYIFLRDKFFSEKLFEYYGDMRRICAGGFKGKKIHILESSFDQEIISTIYRGYNFDVVSYSINNSVEEYHRSVNTKKIRDFFHEKQIRL